MIRAMSTELFLNFLGIRMDSVKAEGMRFTINLITPDNGEKFLIEMENATLTNIQGFLSDKPDLTLTINRADLEKTMMGAKTLDAQIADGTAKARRRCGRAQAARLHDGRLRPALPDHARHQGEGYRRQDGGAVRGHPAGDDCGIGRTLRLESSAAGARISIGGQSVPMAAMEDRW